MERFRNRIDAKIAIEQCWQVRAAQPVSAVVREEIHAIVRESLRNAFQHVKATDIQIMLIFRPTFLALSEKDNGIGIESRVFSQGSKANHFGLPGMHERAGRVGGRLLIHSALGSGTEVALSIPAHSLMAFESDEC